jgi:hypothetical protein
MPTDVSIASQALTLLRANTIDSFSDGSNEAEIASVFYDDFISDIFSRYPWSFAKKKDELTVDATAPINEWTYAHQMPTDAARILAIYNSDAVGAKPIRDWERSGEFIHSDHAELWAEYTYEVSESSWPGYFTQFAIPALAALLALPVTDDENVAAYWKRIAYGTDEENERGGKFGVAASTDAQSTPPEEVAMPDLILARFC